MGSPVHIVLYTMDAQTAKNAAAKAFARVAGLDQTFSDYNPESELMKLVDHFARTGAAPGAVSADLYDILKKSLAISEATGGVFDIPAAPVIRQWRRARREHKLPSPDNLREALSRVGFRRVKLQDNGRKVELEPGTKLDLGGIAKGYAAQAALVELRKLNIDSALVSIAGAGRVLKMDPATVGRKVARPGVNPSTDEPLAVLDLADATVSTSGDAERFVEIDGQRYSHIVDVKTGLGLKRRATVTVVARDGASSDSYATALYALGADGADLLGRLKNPPALAVSWLEERPGGGRERRTNLAFDELLKLAGQAAGR